MIYFRKMISSSSALKGINKMMILSLARKFHGCCITSPRTFATTSSETKEFETVFSFPFVKYIAQFNRLKVYHLYGSGVAVSSCGLLEFFNILPEHCIYSAAYIALTGAAVLSAASLPFRNIIGFLYVSNDNKHVKISSVDFWGKRVDRVITVDEWIPLLDIKPKALDGLYLSPQLADNTKYKLFMKFGNVVNSKKISEVLE